MKHLFLCILLVALFTPLTLAQAEFDPQIVEDSLIMTQVPMRSGSTVDLHVKIWENVSPNCWAGFGNTVLAFHGITETASIWGNIASAVLNNYQDKSWDGALISGNICRFVALDMPGHGRSSFPTGGSLLFGDMVVEDWAVAAFAAMDRLKAINVRPTILMGHSAGGLLIEIMQDTLLKQRMGACLRKTYGIRHAILLAPAPPAGFPLSFFEDPAFGASVQPFIFLDPKFGAYFLMPPLGWIVPIFSGVDGKVIASAPTVDEVISRQYQSPESMGVLLQLASYGPFRRPSVDAGIFAPFRGTNLRMVAFENDIIVRHQEVQPVYRYLTFDDSNARYVVVKGTESVHGMLISDAAMLLEKTSDQIGIPLVIGDSIKP
jgi:pimeloyl-ACP methyl ester carboxylesterase